MFATLYKKLFYGATARYKKQILAAIDPIAGQARLLDCGCDDGEWTERLGAKVGRPELHGIEINAEAAEKAARRGIHVANADLNVSFPYEDGFFDVIHANQVIEHLHDTDAFIGEVFRTLKPGGAAVICTENLASWHNIFCLLMGWQPFTLTNICCKKAQIGNPFALHAGETAELPKSWQHMRAFSYRGLRDVFTEHGFRVERHTGAGYYPLPSWVGRLDPRHAAFQAIKVRKPSCAKPPSLPGPAAGQLHRRPHL